MAGSPCPKCHSESLSDQECTHCGIVFAKYREHLDAEKIYRSNANRYAPAQSAEVNPSDESPVDQINRNPWVAIGFLPIASFVVVLLDSWTIVKIFSFGFTHWFHEFGHAGVAWLGARASLPIIGLAIMSYEKTVLTFVCLAGLLGFLIYSGVRYKLPYLSALAVAFFILQIYFTFFASDRFWTMSMIYAGVGGEFLLASIVIAAFPIDLPKQTYWELLRWIVVPWSLSSFWQSFSKWYQIWQGHEMVPWGTMWGGDDDQNGDMNRLHFEFGFSKEDLASTYMKTALISFAILFGVYLWYAIRAGIRLTREGGLKESPAKL